MAVRGILLYVIYVDNQRTGADMCGNLNTKLWDMKRTGNIKSVLDFCGRSKNNEIYIPFKSDMFSLTFV